jgi:hypothetical protein
MEEFLNAGHDAYSCDLLPSSGKYPERHLQMDCFDAIELVKPDFLGMHPECTRLTVTANKWYKPEYAERFPNIHIEREQAVDHFMKCVEALEIVGKGYIENPIGIMSTRYRKPDQIVQPWQYGDPVPKSTCLWIAGLPKLVPTNIVEPQYIIGKRDGKKYSLIHYMNVSMAKGERRKVSGER